MGDERRGCAVGGWVLNVPSQVDEDVVNEARGALPDAQSRVRRGGAIQHEGRRGATERAGVPTTQDAIIKKT